jgi:hypothetical protein
MKTNCKLVPLVVFTCMSLVSLGAVFSAQSFGNNCTCAVKDQSGVTSNHYSTSPSESWCRDTCTDTGGTFVSFTPLI